MERGQARAAEAGPPRPSGCATSSAAASTCSRRRAAPPARSPRRSTSTTRSRAFVQELRGVLVRPCRDPARRTAGGAGDGHGRAWAPTLPAAGQRDRASPTRSSRRWSSGGRDRLPRGHRRPALSTGGGPARAGRPRTRPRAAAARRSRSIGALAISRTEARVVHERGGRARDAPRPARRDGRPEPAHLRGRAGDRGGAAAPVGAPGRLRLARLARAAQPDGGGDRLGPDAAAALARAQARAARRPSSP